jgi:hypothetical protein
MRIAKQASRRMAEYFICNVLVPISGLAYGKVASFALITLSADDRERDNDPIAFFELSVDAGPHFHHFSHHLVPHDVAGHHCRNKIVKKMKVRTANRAAGHFDYGVSGILDGGIGDAITSDILFPMPNESFHTSLPLSGNDGSHAAEWRW